MCHRVGGNTVAREAGRASVRNCEGRPVARGLLFPEGGPVLLPESSVMVGRALLLVTLLGPFGLPGTALASFEGVDPDRIREVCGTGGVLNLRSAPSMSARVLDRLPDEYDLLVLGTSGSGQWLRVRDEGGRTGWVARRFTCEDDGAVTGVGPWIDPAPGACVTSPFGPRKRPCFGCSRNHRGVDLGVCDRPVLAAAGGRVLHARWDRRGGNVVAVDHGGGMVTWYLHLKRRSVKPGQRVRPGTPIGIAGRTGTATTGCHLHFEVRRNGLALDPLTFLPRKVPAT